MVYTTALFSDAQLDIRSQSDEGGVEDAKSGKLLLPGTIGVCADIAKGKGILKREKMVKEGNRRAVRWRGTCRSIDGEGERRQL
jgi:hypothetical protein